jgi:hypothetical protein
LPTRFFRVVDVNGWKDAALKFVSKGLRHAKIFSRIPVEGDLYFY